MMEIKIKCKECGFKGDEDDFSLRTIEYEDSEELVIECLKCGNERHIWVNLM